MIGCSIAPGRRIAPAAVLVLVACLSLACQSPGRPSVPDGTTAASPGGAAPTGGSPAATGAADPVRRGEYLVTITGCDDCHTPLAMTPNGPAPDMARRFSGHPESLVMPPPPKPAGPWLWQGAGTNTAYAGPWGVSYAANITPDEVTGLGIWTEEQFIAAMRTGKHWGTSRMILPPMPWPFYAKMTDPDLHAVWAYLRTIPPVRNQVPAPVEAEPPPAAAS